MIAYRHVDKDIFGELLTGGMIEVDGTRYKGPEGREYSQKYINSVLTDHWHKKHGVKSFQRLYVRDKIWTKNYRVVITNCLTTE